MGDIRHIYTQTVADGTDTTVVRPTDWNSKHAFTLFEALVPGGNTAGATGSISSGTLMLAGGNNVTLSQNGNSLTISAPNATVFSNSNNVTFGLAGSTITASVTVAATPQTQFVLSNSNGMTWGTNVSTVTGSYTVPGATVFSNSNNVSFGLNGSTITATATNSQSTAPGGLAASAIATTFTSGTVVFSGSNNITISTAAQAIIISGPNTHAQQTGISSIVGSNATYTSGSVEFTGSNMVTVRSSANQRIVIDASQSVQTQSRFNLTLAGNSTSGGAGYIEISSGTMRLAGGNNVTLSQDGNSVTISGGAAGGADGVNALVVNAGASTASTTLSLSNSNNVSFGLAAGVITASASYSQSTAPGGLAATNVATTFTSGTIVLSGSNNITISTAAQAIIISGPNTHAQQTGISGLGAVGGTATAGTVIFSNSNNVSFGFNASTITASATLPTQTGISAISADGSYTSGTVRISGSGNVSVYTSGAGQTLIISGSSQSVQTQNLHNVTLAGNSTSGGAGYIQISSGTMRLAGGNNITLSQDGQSITISGANLGGAQTGISSVVASNTTYTSGMILFSNQANVTIGSSVDGVSQYVRLSVAAGGAADGVNALVVNGGASTATTTLVLSNSNNVSFGHNAGTITASASYSQPGATVFSNSNNVSFGLNGSTITATATNSQSSNLAAVAATNIATTFTSGTVVFSGSNNITVSTAAQAIIISGPNTHAQQTGISSIAVNAASTVSGGAVVFSNSNNVTFGMAGSTITASVTVAPTAQTQFVLSNSNGMGWGTNGSTVTGSYTVPGATVFSNSNNVTFGLNGSTVTASASYTSTNPAVSNSAGSFTFQTLNFSNANNVTWGTSAGGIVTASVAAPGAAAENNWVNLSGNTAGNTTASGSTINWVGGNNVTLSGLNASQVRIDAGGGGGGAGISAGTQSVSTGTVNFANSNSFTFGMSNSNQITASFSESTHGHGGFAITGNTSGTLSTISSGTALLAGGNNITLSQNGQSITISAAGAGAGWNDSFYTNVAQGATITLAAAAGTVYFQPFDLKENQYVLQLRMPMQATTQPTTTQSFSASVSGAVNYTAQGAGVSTFTALFFSRFSTGSYAESSRIQSFYSTTMTQSIGYTASVSASTNVSSATVSLSTTAAAGFISQINSNSYTTGSYSESGSTTFSSTSTNANSFSSSFGMSFASKMLSGVRPVIMAMNTTVVASANRWLAWITSNATSSSTLSLQRLCSMQASMVFASSNTSWPAEFGISNLLTSSQNWPGLGSYSASSQTTTTIPLSQISYQSGYVQPFMLLGWHHNS